MIRLFKHYVPTPLLLLGVFDYVLLFLSAEAAWRVRGAQIDFFRPIDSRISELVTYTVVMGVTMLAVGLYQADGQRAWRMTATRMVVAFLIGFNLLSVIFYVFPPLALWRSITLYAVVFSFAALMLMRALFTRLVSLDGLRRRVVVLGAGARAAKLREISLEKHASFRVARFVQMSTAAPAVPDPLQRADAGALRELVDLHGADEVVLAMEERRGSLPVADLLQVKLSGVRVSDMSTFLERETGRVDLSSVSPSWLIFSDGFLGAQQGALILKRTTDIAAAALLLFAASPILLVTAALVKWTSPGPVFYRQQRVGAFGKLFDVIKFRSMREDAEGDGQPKWAQAADPRVTWVGRIIRMSRIDEIPQIINVLRGDMSFVGPRPERPFFVRELANEIPFYNERHVVKPGITGWAQLNYPYGASIDDARQKLEYDLYYVKNYSPFLDLLILIQTVRVILWRDGVR